MLSATAAQAQDTVSHSSHHCATTEGAKIETARIQAVTDGDTVVLADGRRVRVIGINAPELSKQNERALRDEAIQARDVIDALIKIDPNVELVLGNENSDHYGRVLAHVSFANGTSIATVLLAQGLASATAVAPNTRCADYYLRIEQSARAQTRGVWQYKDNPWFAQNVKTSNIVGFHILTDKVTDVRTNKNKVTLTLASGVTVRAQASILSAADIAELEAMAEAARHADDRDTQNQDYSEKAVSDSTGVIEVRGWFGRNKGLTSVKLHHRSNLSLIR